MSKAKTRVIKTFADLHAEFAKNFSVGDVHVPAASGNKSPKKPVAKNDDWNLAVEVTKVDSDLQQVFGWASIAVKDGQYVVDKHEDIIPVDELEKAAYDFVLNFRDQDDMHLGGPTGRCIESMVFTPEKAEKGLVAKNSAGEQLYGWFVGFQVDDPALWKAYKDGKRPEFSIGGSAHKEKIS